MDATWIYLDNLYDHLIFAKNEKQDYRKNISKLCG